MAVPVVNLELDSVRVTNDDWFLTAEGSFAEGVHLVSGEVGSGKTSLALIMAGLCSPRTGSVLRNGISSVMISFQFPESHITGSTVREECDSWGSDSDWILKDAHLEDHADRDPLNLSRGEMKRLNLACVMNGSYELLILDEPFSSLDVIEKDRICKEISQRSKGITIIFTHEQEIFPRIDHLWEIHRGTLINCGQVPGALLNWKNAPPLIQKLVARGKLPVNITREDLVEAACRT